MKKIILISFFLLLNQCSFDNKTGIWKDASKQKTSGFEKIKRVEESKKKIVKSYFITDKIILKDQNPDGSHTINLGTKIKNQNWLQEFYNYSNNINNIDYNNNKSSILKSKKLARFSITEDINYNKFLEPIYYNDLIISYDHNGTIYVFSIKDKKKIWEFNFYKKKFKKYKKRLFIVLDNQKIYVSDNLGYLYALDYKKQEIIWAKNFGIPFRSNVKIFENKIFLANQDNIIYCVDTLTGDKFWEFATTSTFLKSSFKNNILLDNPKSNVLFFNTSGELYSINYISKNINYVLSFKDISFSSLPIVKRKNTILVSTGKNIYSYNDETGAQNWAKSISLVSKPILTDNNIFLITENNFLVCLNSSNGKIIWSKNVLHQIKNIKEEKKNKKIGSATSHIIADSQIHIFTSKGFILSFDYKNGTLKDYKNISKKGFGSNPIFAQGKMKFFNKNFQILVFD
tara:strand:- start:441 stop:1811 length:1371 start_codon:yes stop_codon:yes gene_type:complete